MESSDRRLVTIRSVSHEWEAALIVAALAEHDIPAVTVGEFTAEFRAEAPRLVKVQVAPEDFERGDSLLRECFSLPDPEEESEDAWQTTMGWSTNGWTKFVKYSIIVGLIAELGWLLTYLIDLFGSGID